MGCQPSRSPQPQTSAINRSKAPKKTSSYNIGKNELMVVNVCEVASQINDNPGTSTLNQNNIVKQLPNKPANIEKPAQPEQVMTKNMRNYNGIGMATNMKQSVKQQMTNAESTPNLLVVDNKKIKKNRHSPLR